MDNTLETILPPVSILWLAHEWTCKSQSDVQMAIETINNRLVQYFAISPHYIADVVQLCCNLHARVVPAVSYVVPSYSTYNPTVTAETNTHIVSSIQQVAATHAVTAMYAYSIAHPLMHGLTERMCTTAPRTRLRTVMHTVAVDCKFEVTGDLFIWCILYMKMPAWVGAARCARDRPYALVSHVFGEDTNIVVQPWIKRSVATVLECPQTMPHEKFLIYACLAMELVHCKSGVLVNSDILKADQNTPTFAVTHGALSPTGQTRFGHVLNGVFYVCADPLSAVKHWAAACDADSHFARLGDDGQAAMPGCPFAKHLV